MVCKGLAAAKKETPDPSPDVAKLITYFEAVEEFKHSTDGFATAMQLEKLELHKEHVPMPLLGSKEVGIEQLREGILTIFVKSINLLFPIVFTFLSKYTLVN